jgi:hypothetical protein
MEELYNQRSGRHLDRKMIEEGINEQVFLEIEEEDMNAISINSRFASEAAISITFYRI